MASIIKADTLQSTTANVFVLNSSGTEYARFDSTGNFFLGAASSPSNSTKLLSYATANQSAITINATNALQTDDVVLIRNTRNTNNGSYNALTVYNDGAAAYRFQLTDGGNIGLFGGQIKFPATQSASADANTLDDYEEGTWTPSVGGNATYGTRIAHYTKIGDTVRAFFDITIGTIGTGSLTTMSGFPFTCTNNDSGCISYFAGLGATVYFIQIQMSGTNCIFVGLTAAGATVNNGMNVFTTGARIIGTVVYKTTT